MKKIYLTFDMDWANDGVLEYFYSLLKGLDVAATIFVTHDTVWLKQFRAEHKFELGIHPNYNSLFSLAGEGMRYSVYDVLKQMKNIVPEAVCCRSHALTSGSVISKEYEKLGINYELNTYIPAQVGMKIFPYKSWIGNFSVLPFIFEDDVWLAEGKGRDFQYYLSDFFEAPRIFNFHPIHLYLNTKNIQHYEEARPYFKELSKLRELQNESEYGIRDFFIDLVSSAKQEGWESKKIVEGKWE